MTYGDVLRKFSNEQLANYIADYAVRVRHKFLEDRDCADVDVDDKENIKTGLLLALSKDVPGTENQDIPASVSESSASPMSGLFSSMLGASGSPNLPVEANSEIVESSEIETTEVQSDVIS